MSFDEILEKAFFDLAWPALVEFAFAKLFTAVPFLAWGPIKFVVMWLAGMVLSALKEALQEAVDFGQIVMKNKELHAAHVARQLELRRVALESGVRSPAFEEALVDGQKALQEFVRIRITRGR